ncbi:uncharacterized protein G2W53_027563 [Senna tora]|uniref:Uncharacterized protein n=1 Tax=Senna tora TaxID=362788 RepID=A0A834WIJ4_9FABA|nr:uncharacterized protein G2W53_027563 [Senna tora]
MGTCASTPLGVWKDGDLAPPRRSRVAKVGLK